MTVNPSRRALLLGLTASVLATASCGLPRSGPNKNEIFAGSGMRKGDAFIVEVNDHVTRATAVVPALGFTSSFQGAGMLGSDTIRPGDTLGLTIWENVDDGLLAVAGANATQLTEMQVDGSGYIFVPYAGRIKAAGNSPEELRRLITSKLDAQTPDPQVLVTRLAGDGSTVSIMGAINGQGVYTIERPTRTLAAMIARAGGVSIEPEIAKITVKRSGKAGHCAAPRRRDPGGKGHPRLYLAGRHRQSGPRALRDADPFGAGGDRHCGRAANKPCRPDRGLRVPQRTGRNRIRRAGPKRSDREPADGLCAGSDPAQRHIHGTRLHHPRRRYHLCHRGALCAVAKETFGADRLSGHCEHAQQSRRELMTGTVDEDGAGAGSRRLFFYNGGVLMQPRLRAILRAAGWQLRLGRPGPEDSVMVWGRSGYAARGEAVAARTGARLIRLEDAFLRSIRPGRAGDPPLGLLIDPEGVHFDSAQPSRIERILADAPLDDTVVLQRAEDGIARLKALDLSKYNNFDPEAPLPDPGYVLVIDQTRGDASIHHGGATARHFHQMLTVARIENPGAHILIKTHPETQSGLRAGHFGPEHCDARTSLLSHPVSPWRLLEGANAVYTISSLMGYEAILAGHRPRVFGQPFYAGWGLSQDENPVPRRTRRLTPAQIFAVSHILAPTWFDPCRGHICSFEEAVDQLEAEVRAFREDRHGYVAGGMSLWKRPHLRRFFGRHGPLHFADSGARPHLHWASRVTPAVEARARADRQPLIRVEDGFLRSRGLGAELVPPLSLIADRQGIYYDPSRPSDLETLIPAEPPAGGRERAERLLQRIALAGLTKYNLGGDHPDLPEGHRILVPGQVEDDASIRLGTDKICTNLMLLARCRAENPSAVILFKPHPDVEAGLRPGRISEAAALEHADAILHKSDPVTLIDAVDEIWTMTSGLGFEALIRGKPVTTLGAPFYAGWGLTRDLGHVPDRRRARPDLAQFVHAVLIAYPRYSDPVSGLPCPPETVLDRLIHGPLPRPGPFNRLTSKLQGILAGYAWVWRRQR